MLRGNKRGQLDENSPQWGYLSQPTNKQQVLRPKQQNRLLSLPSSATHMSPPPPLLLRNTANIYQKATRHFIHLKRRQMLSFFWQSHPFSFLGFLERHLGIDLSKCIFFPVFWAISRNEMMFKFSRQFTSSANIGSALYVTRLNVWLWLSEWWMGMWRIWLSCGPPEFASHQSNS